MAGSSPAMTGDGTGEGPLRTRMQETCDGTALPHVEHKNVWGFAGLPLESPWLPSHIGTAARKHGLRWGTAGILSQAVGR